MCATLVTNFKNQSGDFKKDVESLQGEVHQLWPITMVYLRPIHSMTMCKKCPTKREQHLHLIENSHLH
jgi:hypothetical protein